MCSKHVLLKVPLLVLACRLRAQADRQRELQEHRDKCRQRADQQVWPMVMFLTTCVDQNKLHQLSLRWSHCHNNGCPAAGLEHV